MQAAPSAPADAVAPVRLYSVPATQTIARGLLGLAVVALAVAVWMLAAGRNRLEMVFALVCAAEFGLAARIAHRSRLAGPVLRLELDAEGLHIVRRERAARVPWPSVVEIELDNASDGADRLRIAAVDSAGAVRKFKVTLPLVTESGQRLDARLLDAFRAQVRARD